MEPAYLEGDHVLTFNWSKIREHDVIVFRSGRIYFLKRVIKIDDSFINVEGDSKKLSSKVGPVEISSVVGRVIFKY